MMPRGGGCGCKSGQSPSRGVLAGSFLCLGVRPSLFPATPGLPNLLPFVSGGRLGVPHASEHFFPKHCQRIEFRKSLPRADPKSSGAFVGHLGSHPPVLTLHLGDPLGPFAESPQQRGHNTTRHLVSLSAGTLGRRPGTRFAAAPAS